MNIIHPSKLNGKLTARPSKSMLHRLLICAALAKGESRVSNFMHSEDIDATLGALKAMGFCDYSLYDGVCTVHGGLRGTSDAAIGCAESGSTLRFLLPLAFDGQERIFTGRGRLMERPMEPYAKLFESRGYRHSREGIGVCGALSPGRYEVDGGISSQFVTGLLFALPLLEGDSLIVIKGGLQSRAYVDITLQCLSEFGVTAKFDRNEIRVKGNQRYMPRDVSAEGDFSHAAFFAVAAAMGGDVAISGLNPYSVQGDRAVFDILGVMGADVKWEGGRVRVKRKPLQPVELNVADVPDLMPALAVLACAAEGRTSILGAERLRYKESDRLAAMSAELEKLGADVAEFEDSLIVHGSGALKGGSVSTHGDHRIAMALSIASSIAENDIVLDDPGVVKKSAPEFFDEFASLGGSIG